MAFVQCAHRRHQANGLPGGPRPGAGSWLNVPRSRHHLRRLRLSVDGAVHCDDPTAGSVTRQFSTIHRMASMAAVSSVRASRRSPPGIVQDGALVRP